MFKFFKKNRKEIDFFAVETKKVGKFVEYNNKTGFRKEYEFTAEEKNFVGAWICEAKANNNEYLVVAY